MKVNYFVFAFFIVTLLQGIHSREVVHLYDTSIVLAEQSIINHLNFSFPISVELNSLTDFTEFSNPDLLIETNDVPVYYVYRDVSCSIFTLNNPFDFLTNFNF